jgi:hypothetical protein
MRQPDLFFQELRCCRYNNLEGVREITYHLGRDFFWDPDGTLT